MSRFTTDIPELKRRVKLSALISRTVELRHHGREFQGLCPFHKEETPSFTVNDEKMFYHCFGCQAHGDAITWISQRDGLSRGDAIGRLRVLAGEMQSRMRPPSVIKPLPPVKKPETPDANMKGLLERLWAESAALAGSPAEAYLRQRGIFVERIKGFITTSLRFHPQLKHQESDRYFPAMLLQIVNAKGELLGLHRTFLQAQAGGRVTKAPVSPAKKMLGRHAGGAGVLCMPAREMAVAEGIETALSVAQATRMPCWAALSLGNMETIGLPEFVEKLVVCVDADMKDTALAERAKNRIAVAHLLARRRVSIATPKQGTDFNDMLKGASV